VSWTSVSALANSWNGILSDSRRGKNVQLPLADLLRQSIYSRLAGYEDVNDAGRLSQDPTFRLIGSRKIWERGAALTSRLQSFETELLTQEENLGGLAVLNRELITRAEAIDSPRRVVLDMDSTEIPVYGQQEQSAYNGHFESTCYHPLLYSIAKATAWQPSYGLATPTEPRAGRNCCQRLNGNRGWARRWSSAPMQPLPSRRSTRRWKSRTGSTRSAFQRTTICSGTLRSC
jgi:Transposase DDE domain group 1